MLKGAALTNMRIRLGYVGLVLNLKDCTPSGTVTARTFNSLPDRETAFNKLRRVGRKNLCNTLRILKYNKALGIRVYRLTSKLIPLATYPEADSWDYTGDLAGEFREAGNFIRENDMRISAHPDHFTLLNSKSKRVLDNSVRDLDYHVRVYEAMGLDDSRYKLVMHVGGRYSDKRESVKRFVKNFAALPDRIRSRIVLENDDRSYTASEVLSLCRELSIPMVLDIHHHSCINSGERLEDLIGPAFDTWDKEYWPPKVHFSSPRDCSNRRYHADYIELDEFVSFLEIASYTGRNFDIMLEVKKKDSALLKLTDQLKETKGIDVISNGEFIL